MNAIRRSVIVSSIIMLAGGAALFAADTRPAPRPTEDRYEILTRQNMFVKDRRAPFTPGRRDASDGPATRVAPPPEAQYVLRGVVLEDDQFRAYFEDTHSGRLLRLNVGDPIARGRLAAVDIDAVAYEAAGQTNWIGVGSDLKGAVVASTPTYTSSTSRPSTPGGASSAPSTSSDPGTMSIEERMRQRRLEGK